MVDFSENIVEPSVFIKAGDFSNYQPLKAMHVFWTCFRNIGIFLLVTGIKKLMGVDDSLFGLGTTRTQVLQMALAELVGTGLLVFLGCMGTVVGMSHSAHPHLLIAFAFGLTVMIVIQVGARKTLVAISNLRIINQPES